MFKFTGRVKHFYSVREGNAYSDRYTRQPRPDSWDESTTVYGDTLEAAKEVLWQAVPRNRLKPGYPQQDLGWDREFVLDSTEQLLPDPEPEPTSAAVPRPRHPSRYR